MGRSTTQVLNPVTYLVYIGPTIKSAAQHNTILSGTREEIEKRLAPAIEKYPPIAQLLITGEELAAARKMIKQPGNRLFEENKRLLKMLKTNGG